MSDAINSIDTSALGSPGCASYVYTLRSYEPFIRDAFDQFSETRTGGAFTFTTGIGGFLQEFLYGYSGLRWSATAVDLAPSLTSQLGGVTLHNLMWHGRTFTVVIGPRSTTITAQSGGALPVTVAGATHTIAAGQALTVPTGRPDLSHTTDLARCQAATASSAQPGADPLAAVDGSPATDWQAQQVTASLTVPLAKAATIRSATLDWGQAYPPPPAPNVPPPPGPVTPLRASSYDLQVSADGTSWTTVAQVRGATTGTQDRLTFRPVRARYVRVEITATTGNAPAMLEEVTIPGS
jgi:hypothetical protein